MDCVQEKGICELSVIIENHSSSETSSIDFYFVKLLPRDLFNWYRRPGGNCTFCHYALADPRGGARDAPPPGGPNSFIFMQFSAKN